MVNVVESEGTTGENVELTRSKSPVSPDVTIALDMLKLSLAQELVSRFL